MRASKLVAPIIFLVISELIVATWFKDGIFYGGAEVGLFTYNPQRWFEISRYVWWGAVAPGQLIPHFITGAPIYFLFYILNLIGLSAQNIQLVFFFLLFFLMGFGIYSLAFDIFDEDREKYSLIAGLFYMFNAYILVQVWHRFLYSTLILAAVLPFLILFWRRWIRCGRVLNLSLFLLINFLAVYMYGNLASVITVWTALALVSFTEAIFPWQGKVNVTKVGLRFLGGFIFWFLVNLWWIAPTFLVAPGLLSAQHSSEDNLGTLVVISRQTIMPYLLQLANPFYLFYRQELGQIYSNVLFKVIPWIMSAVILLGLIVSLRIKNYAKYSIIFILTVLLAKGAASPFSYPYIFSFKQFYFLGVLRNPFEKFGILLPVFGAILFAIGWQALFKWLNMRLGSTLAKTVLILILTALLGYAWPMIGGRIFGTREFSVKVKVPESYRQADAWLGEQEKDQGVILHLPFSARDVVTYQWENGYHGVDQNEILFTALPSLTKTVGIKRIDDTLNSLTYIFTSPFANDQKQILEILQLFNVRFILLHKDIKWDDKDTYGEKAGLLEPVKIEKTLDSLVYLKKELEFGLLVIYQLSDEYYKNTITSAQSYQVIYPGGSDILRILPKSYSYGDIITPVSDKIDEEILRKSRQTLVLPDKKIEYVESSPSASVAKANESFNKLGQIKAYFFSIGYLQSEKLTDELILAMQKVIQLYQDALQNKLLSDSQINDYEQLIKSVVRKYSKNTSMRLIFDSDFPNLMKLHLLILRQIGASTIADWIDGEMIKMEVFPKYRNLTEVFKFTVPFRGSYEILADPQDEDILINGENIVSKKDIVFDQASYEISLKDKIDDVVLRQQGLEEGVSANQVLGFKKESPVSYSGKINFTSPAFLIFAQGYHPGWHLSLTRSGKQEKVGGHFLSNLYGNAWWVDKTGEYDFKIEFSPQKDVNRGIIIALVASLVLVLANLYPYWKNGVRK